jgi:LEA14-like dessication related protein
MKKPLQLLLLLVLCLSLSTCASINKIFKEPVLTFQSAEITKLNFTGLELLCKVKVENPNPITIPFPDIDWEFFVNANSFVKGQINAHQSIRARSSNIIEVPVSFNYRDVFNTFVSLRNSNQAAYKVALAAKFLLPVIGEKVWHLQHEGNFPVLHLPTVKFGSLAVKNISLTALEFELAWEVENTNTFDMSVKDLSYNLSVNNSTWTSGRVPGAPQIPAGRTTRIPINFTINGLAMVREITEIITRGTSINYTLGGNINLGAALPGLADFGTPFNFTGSTRLR